MRKWQTMTVGVLMALGLVGRGGPAHAAPAPLTLTRDGQPAAAIVLAEKPTKAAQFAAFELQWHVKAISGATLPIVRAETAVPPGYVKLFVGDGARAQALGLTQDALKLQEYAVRLGKDEIVLVGKDAADFAEVKYDLDALNDGAKNANWPGFWEEQATLYAIHDFLRDVCGVRWFNATDTGSVIPQQPTLTVKVKDLRRTPTFRYREAIGGDAEGYDRGVSLWGTKMAEGFQAWEKLAYADSRARQGDGTAVKRAQAALFLLRMRNGGELCRANHSLYHYYDMFWRPSKNEDAAKWFMGKRPDFFAQGYEGDEPPQMCYTSTGLLAQVTKEANEYFDKGGYPYPGSLCTAPTGAKWGKNFFCIEPMDNSSFCKCPSCQALVAKGLDYGVGDHFSTGIYGDYMFSFVSQVAKDVKKAHPDKNIVACAYGSHAYVPRDFKLDPYVAVQFCFASDGAPWSTSEFNQEWWLANEWGKEAKASGRPLYAWCYYGHMYRAFADNGNFHCFPGFFVHSMAKEMKLYKKLGYRGMFHCGLAPDIDTYVMFRMMDNADLDVDRVLGEYFTGLYGTAGEPLKKFYLAVEKTYSDPALRPTDKNVSPASVEAAWGYLGTAERMAEWKKLMDAARSLATTPREKRNLELFELATWKYMTQGRAQYVTRKSTPIPSISVPAVPDAGGDAAKVGWEKAVPMTGGWFAAGGKTPAPRQFTGRMAHDGVYLYIELVDPCVTKNLTASPGVACFDDWEISIGSQRGLPYRQFLVGPTGMAVANLNGEVNWRMFVPFMEHGVKVVSDTSASDKWIERIAIPLKSLLPGGAKPGDKLFASVIRVSGPAITGAGLGIDSWVPYTTVLEMDRAAEVTLAK